MALQRCQVGLHEGAVDKTVLGRILMILLGDPKIMFRHWPDGTAWPSTFCKPLALFIYRLTIS